MFLRLCNSVLGYVEQWYRFSTHRIASGTVGPHRWKYMTKVYPKVLRGTPRACADDYTRRRYTTDLYEPDYLISMQPDEPVHDCLNLQIKGYDFTLLENYQSVLHRYAEALGLHVEDGWACPAQQLKIQRYKPMSTAIESEYHLNIYERNLQLEDVPGWALGTLIRTARATLPEGCTLHVLEHTPELEEVRYVPDNQLLDLKQQLGDMGGSRLPKGRK